MLQAGRRAAIAVAAWPVLVCATAWGADELPAYAASGGDWRVNALSLQRPKLLSGETYTESFAFWSVFTNAGVMKTQVIFTNLGMGDGKAGIRIVWIKPSGQAIKADADLGSGDWSYDEATHTVKMGDSVFSANQDGYVMNLATKDVSVSLTFSRTLAAWRPGDGRVDFGGGRGHYNVALVMPRGRVAGAIQESGQEPLAVQGSAQGENSYSVGNPANQAQRWVRLKGFWGEYTTFFTAFYPAAGLPQEPVGWLYVAHKGAVIAQANRVKLDIESLRPDPGGSKVQVPAVLRTSASGAPAAANLKTTARSLLYREDLLAEMNALKAAVVRQFSQPLTVMYRANYEGEIANGATPTPISGPGLLEVSFVTR